MLVKVRSPGSLVVLCVVIYVGLIIRLVYTYSPVFNEMGHLPAGLSHLGFGRFELYRVNPPLPRMVGAIPVFFCRPQYAWGNYTANPFTEETIPMAVRFAEANGSRTVSLFRVARISCIPFAIIGAISCFAWARDLWGIQGGFCALFLWCSNPFFLGHAALLMPDVPASSLMVCSAYCFWKWNREDSWRFILAAGITLGAAVLCKFTAVLMVPIWSSAVVVQCFFDLSWRGYVKRRLLSAAALFTISLYIVNLGYGFHGSFRPIGKFEFQSKLLSGSTTLHRPGNRFSTSVIGWLPSPFPADFVQGIDHQLFDFDVGELSYFNGVWRQPGWCSYHIAGLLAKTPLGTLGVMLLAIWLAAVARDGKSVQAEFLLLAHIVCIVAMVSMQTGFSNHVRYVIPSLPFVFVWAGRVFSAGLGRIKIAAIVLLGISGVESLSVFPHCISFFNVAVGGAAAGHELFLDSNIAWGQDLLGLKKWWDDNPQARPLNAALFGLFDPRHVGLKVQLPPVGPKTPQQIDQVAARDAGPRPGWFAIDVNYLHGSHYHVMDGNGMWKAVPTFGWNYEYFRRFTPVSRIGYSIYIYHISKDEADRVRAELGLPAIDGRD